MRTAFRFLRLMALIVWVGGILFFAFLLAPTAFAALPVREAGLVVGGTLRQFDLVGLVCGCVLLMLTPAALLRPGPVQRGRTLAELVLATAMVLFTLFLHLHILPAMDRDQAAAGGDVNAVALTNPARMDFNRLHALSEQAESVVLLCGLGFAGLFAGERDGKLELFP